MLPPLSLKFTLVAVVASLLAAFAHGLLPSKQLVVVPNADSRLLLFHDGNDGGSSKAYWDEQRATKAICEINASDSSQYCGVLVSLGDGKSKGVDVSSYDSLKVSLRYSGESPRLRVFMRNHDPLFSTVGNTDTAKFNAVSVPVKDFAKPLHLPLEDFAVAEWWLANFGVPRERSQPDLSNVIKLGFDLPNPIPLGRHELQLDRLVFVGQWVRQWQWYLGLLIVWIGFIASWMVRHSLRIRRRLAMDDARLAALAASSGDPINEGDSASDRDQLTGAMSRSGMGRAMHRLYNAEGTALRPCAMVLLDVDGFARLTKRYGHDCANKILHTIGQTMMNNSRATDLVCHWSDDRFLVVAPGARLIDMAVFAEKIRAMVAQEVFPSEQGAFSVTLSAGVAESTPRSSFEQTFALANQALLQAKASGKDTVHCAGL